MRKVALYIAASLDGFIARENGAIDWLPPVDPEGEDYGYREFYDSIDTVLVGRKTWEQSRGFEEEPFKGKRVVVFTRREGTMGAEGAEFVSNPVVFTQGLRRLPGKDIWLVGGSEIVSVLMTAGLVDEVILTVIPVVLGRGIPLFQGIRDDARLSLSGVVKYGDGLVQLRYSISR